MVSLFLVALLGLAGMSALSWFQSGQQIVVSSQQELNRETKIKGALFNNLLEAAFSNVGIEPMRILPPNAATSNKSSLLFYKVNQASGVNAATVSGTGDCANVYAAYDKNNPVPVNCFNLTIDNTVGDNSLYETDRFILLQANDLSQILRIAGRTPGSNVLILDPATPIPIEVNVALQELTSNPNTSRATILPLTLTLIYFVDSDKSLKIQSQNTWDLNLLTLNFASSAPSLLENITNFVLTAKVARKGSLIPGDPCLYNPNVSDYLSPNSGGGLFAMPTAPPSNSFCTFRNMVRLKATVDLEDPNITGVEAEIPVLNPGWNSLTKSQNLCL